MSEQSASRADRAGENGWLARFVDPTVAGIVLYALVAMAAAFAAYFSIFTTFAPYDDEGTSMVRLLGFLEGDNLYADIWSAYGPFYFEFFGAIYTVFGLEVDTNTSRLTVIVLWLVTSLLFGVSAQRLTGNLFLGLAATIASFGILYVLAGEPMHPQGISVLLMGAFTFVAIVALRGRVVAAGVACGAILAALTLSKINLGLLGVAAVALAAVLAIEPLHRRRWVRWPVIATFLVMPFYITARDLGTDWVRELVALETLAALTVLIAAWTVRPRGGEDHGELWRWVVAAVAGFATATLAILVVIVLTGPSPADVYDGIVGQALGIRDVILTRFPFPPRAVDWGIVAVAAVALAVGVRELGTGSGRPSLWPGLLRAAAGLGLWYGATRALPLEVDPAVENPDVIPMLLAWVAVIPPAGVEESPYKRFLRVLLPLFAIAQTLQVYPVAGSQMGIAAVAFVPVGALCLADAVTSLRAWTAARGELAGRRLGLVVAVVAVALTAQLGLDKIVRPGISNAGTYRDRPAMPYGNADLLRLSEEETATYTELVDLLERYRCTDFIGYPNINSLYIWSGIEPPPPNAPGSWPDAVGSDQQQRTVDALRASPRPCAIRSDERAALWLHGDPPPDKPLVNYILDDFTTVAEVEEFEFALPDDRVRGGR